MSDVPVVFLEGVLRHSFGIPASPQAFLNFSDFTNFCMPQGLHTFSKGLSSTERAEVGL
jgi:hypothetical protein